MAVYGHKTGELFPLISSSQLFYAAGRKCDDPACRGDLEDTIINFGESLPVGTNVGA